MKSCGLVVNFPLLAGLCGSASHPATVKTKLARRGAELTQFEFEESPTREQTSFGNLESILSRAERVLAKATSRASDYDRNELRQLSSQIATEVQSFK